MTRSLDLGSIESTVHEASGSEAGAVVSRAGADGRTYGLAFDAAGVTCFCAPITGCMKRIAAAANHATMHPVTRLFMRISA